MHEKKLKLQTQTVMVVSFESGSSRDPPRIISGFFLEGFGDSHIMFVYCTLCNQFSSDIVCVQFHIKIFKMISHHTIYDEQTRYENLLNPHKDDRFFSVVTLLWNKEFY